MHLNAAHRHRPLHALLPWQDPMHQRNAALPHHPSACRRADAVRTSSGTISCAAKRDDRETPRPSSDRNVCGAAGCEPGYGEASQGTGAIDRGRLLRPFGPRNDRWRHAIPASGAAPPLPCLAPSHATQSPVQRNETLVRHCGHKLPPPQLPPTQANRRSGRCFPRASLLASPA
jgi:hypothetical protein